MNVPNCTCGVNDQRRSFLKPSIHIGVEFPGNRLYEGLISFQESMVMSFFKRLFGISATPKEGGAPVSTIEYEGFEISATPQADSGQFRLYGTISKVIDGETKTHTLIRADLLPDADQCSQVTVRKAKQVIDEQGNKLFN